LIPKSEKTNRKNRKVQLTGTGEKRAFSKEVEWEISFWTRKSATDASLAQFQLRFQQFPLKKPFVCAKLLADTTPSTIFIHNFILLRKLHSPTAGSMSSR